MTLTANTTENITSTYEVEGKWTEAADQDNTTLSSIADRTQIDRSHSPAEGDTEEGTRPELPTNLLDPSVSTDIPESEIQATEHVDGTTDVVTLNSSMSGGDNMTSNGNASSDFNATMTTTDEENIETDGEEKSTMPTVTDSGTGVSENGATDASESSGKEDNSTSLSVPGVTTDFLPTNASVTLSYDNATATNITTDIFGNFESTSSTPDGQNLSTNVFETDKDSSDTASRPESSVTLGNVTEGTVITGEVMIESTPFPAGNSTEAVVAVPVSSTSWQVFQIFLVLCVIGLLALGFLYWKRKRRQDDEIPVFTRHTDYHNPTFTMEDAANFMSRAGRNTYKTIE